MRRILTTLTTLIALSLMATASWAGGIINLSAASADLYGSGTVTKLSNPTPLVLGTWVKFPANDASANPVAFRYPALPQDAAAGAVTLTCTVIIREGSVCTAGAAGLIGLPCAADADCNPAGTCTPVDINPVCFEMTATGFPTGSTDTRSSGLQYNLVSITPAVRGGIISGTMDVALPVGNSQSGTQCTGAVCKGFPLLVTMQRKLNTTCGGSSAHAAFLASVACAYP